jgi:hypothetical protein
MGFVPQPILWPYGPIGNIKKKYFEVANCTIGRGAATRMTGTTIKQSDYSEHQIGVNIFYLSL